MSSEYPLPKSLEEFYAHALGLEHECEARLTDLSLTLEAHHNLEAAKVFSQAEQIRARSIELIRQHSQGLALPRIAPWEFLWHQHVNFELVCMDSVHYLISALEAIELVLFKLEAANDFYRIIQDQSPDPDIKRAANEIKSLLELEIEIVRGWREQHEELSRLPDYDPPHQPE